MKTLTTIIVILIGALLSVGIARIIVWRKAIKSQQSCATDYERFVWELKYDNKQYFLHLIMLLILAVLLISILVLVFIAL